MSGFCVKSFSQRYHSFGEALNVAPKPSVAGLFASSTFKIAAVGRQVLLLYLPEPRNWSWYSPSSGVSRGRQCECREMESDPATAIFHVFLERGTLRGLSGRVSRKHNHWYCDRNSAFRLSQFVVESYEKPFFLPSSGRRRLASCTKLMCARSFSPVKNAMTLNPDFCWAWAASIWNMMPRIATRIASGLRTGNSFC